ncbi:tetratricopeptide repeat protein [Mariniflexile sp.]|uniref:tetratricopeptide repeat protein n=1 Tax=Mariniflexile sp. TaxID=1979402 RepID=UPI00404861AC
MKCLSLFTIAFLPLSIFAQHEHHKTNDAAAESHNHLAHMMASRAEIIYVHNLPPPKLMKGAGNSTLKIETTSEKTQAYFNQGVSLLHDFWDFEAYRAFKEAIRNDSTAIMPYWGLLQMPTPNKDSIFKSNMEDAIKRIKKLLPTANEHERLYGEIALLKDSLKQEAYPEISKRWELIIHKFPDDVEAKLFLALNKMSGFDTDMKPMEGQMYSEFLLKDVQRAAPNSHAFHHYWIHLKENCCPEEALASADALTALAPASGHIVHMPGHIYNRVGNYKKAHDAFVAAVKVDSTYMKNEGIEEVDDWNYIHNINYLINNCVHDGRHNEALYYAERLKKMPISKNRKDIYDGRFFHQGLLAPGKMEMAFGNWEQATAEFEQIVDNDSVFSHSNMEFKKALTLFTKGMAALDKNDVSMAISASNSLDALLWRNAKQMDKESTLNQDYQNTINTASLELQGYIASQQGHYEQALMLLKKAHKNEADLGYGEPPLYARPVAMSLAAAQIKAEKYDDAVETYQTLLQRFPKSAYVYNALRIVYAQKGDSVKAKEYTNLLSAAAKYADVGIYEMF